MYLWRLMPYIRASINPFPLHQRKPAMNQPRLLLLPTLLIVLCSLAHAQRSVPSATISGHSLFTHTQPASTLTARGATLYATLSPAQASRLLSSPNQLQLTDFPTTPNSTGDLRLQRRRLAVDRTTKFVVATPTGDLLTDGPNVVLYTGTVANAPGSKVWLTYEANTNQMLTVIEYADGSAYMLGPITDPIQQEVGDHVMVATKQMVLHAGNFACGTVEQMDALPPIPPAPMAADVLAAKNILEVELAVETDSEFFTATGGTVAKAQAYAVAMYAVVSSIYEDEAHITIRIPWMKTWTNSPADPYGVKGDPFALRDKAGPYWKENYASVQRDIFQVATSINYGGGGYGFFEALCGKNPDKGFSVISVQASNPLPTYGFSYDVYIAAHEIGHNFNAPHSHNCYWGAPIDTCVVDEGIEGKCLPEGQQKKPNPGSIMSYCGGTNNDAGLGYTLRMTFLPQVAALIRQTAEAATCISQPATARVMLLNPHGEESYDAGTATQVRWRSSGVEKVTLEYSRNNGSDWTLIAADLPAADESYNWTLPQVCSPTMRVRISNSANPAVADTSMKPFSIVQNDASGLVLYYPFSGNSLDEAGCGYYPASGNATLTADRLGNANSAYAFNGSSSLSAPDYISNFTTFTASYWFKLDNTTGIQTMVGQNWEVDAMFFTYSWDARIGIAAYFNGSGTPFQVWGPTLTANKWYHVAFVFDGSAMKIYLDGVQVASEAKTETLVTAKAPLFVGARGATEYTKGTIDEVRIYRRALSDQEILAQSKEGSVAPAAPALLLPPNSAANQPSSIQLQWQSSATAATYHAQVATNNDFSGTLSLDNNAIAGTSQTVGSLSPNTTYYWRVAGKNSVGTGSWSTTFSFSTAGFSGVTESATTANGATLESATIDPRSNTGTVNIQLRNRRNVTLKIYDLAGRPAIIVASGERESGNHTLRFDASALPSGSYFCVVDVEGEQLVRKVVVAR